MHGMGGGVRNVGRVGWPESKARSCSFCGLSQTLAVSPVVSETSERQDTGVLSLPPPPLAHAHCT